MKNYIKLLRFVIVFGVAILQAVPFSACYSPLQSECMKCCARQVTSSNGIQREKEMRECLINCGSENEPFTTDNGFL